MKTGDIVQIETSSSSRLVGVVADGPSADGWIEVWHIMVSAKGEFLSMSKGLYKIGISKISLLVKGE